MTPCLLCPSKAVSDGLCVTDGARLWVARQWQSMPAPAYGTAKWHKTHELTNPSPRSVAWRDIDTPDKASAFLARIEAANCDGALAALRSAGQ